MVSTLDFESSDPSSNLGRTCLLSPCRRNEMTNTSYWRESGIMKTVKSELSDYFNKTSGLNRDSNPGPLAPKARIIPLDHWAVETKRQTKGNNTLNLSKQQTMFKESNQWKYNANKCQKPPNVGLEPTTLRLRVWCSTDWASRACLS